MGKRFNLKPAEWKLIARMRELTKKQRDGRSRLVLVQRVGDEFEVGVYTPHGILDNSPFDDELFKDEDDEG